MSGRRIIGYLTRAKTPLSTTFLPVRAVHVLPSISTCIRHFDDRIIVDRHRQSLLANNVSYPTFGTSKRFKSQKKKKQETQDEESDEEEDEYMMELAGSTNAKVLTVHVPSMRIDGVIKAGMGIARNKVEVALYQSKIRINGEKVLKKSVQAHIGDTIDLIRGPSPKNPQFIVVSRMLIISAATNENGYRIKFTRDKSLVIENYEDSWAPVNL